MTTPAANAQGVDSFCDADVFRDVIGHFATGVTIITARDGRADLGLTVSAVASLCRSSPR